MIEDLAELPDGTAFNADICIVGAGVAGITLAMRLIGAGVSVLLLESGGEQFEEDTQSLYDGEVVDTALHSPSNTYRQRRFGGTSGIWGGRCVPYDAVDFEQRPWIGGSGWPFGIEELLPFYAQANRICEAGRFAYTVEQAFPLGTPAIIDDFHGRSFSDNTLERFSCPTDFGRRYRARLASSGNIRVLLHANVTDVIAGADGRVEQLAVRTLGGKRFTATATRFVLAMGGLETPRLLLASRTHHPAGLGNGHDWVGRTYMCHIAGTIGAVATNAGAAVSHGYEVSQDGIYCRRRFALTAAAQRRLGVGNFVAHLHHPRIPDPSHRTGFLSALFLMKPFISYEYRKRLHGEGGGSAASLLRHVRNIITDPVDTMATLTHLAWKRVLAERKFPSIIVKPKSGVYSVDFNAEQEPNPDSRIRLISERDSLGMQRISVDWRHSAGDMRTVRHALRALAEDIDASRSGKLSYDEEDIESSSLRDGAYGGHHIGTTRMATSPRQGVVDPNCRVHGTSNLYIASSSVFPTSSQANPTLTVAAMALRLADHLKRAA